ncbi:MAG: hypothetical protein AAFS10_16460, partial [Myxococcota bacterium]
MHYRSVLIIALLALPPLLLGSTHTPTILALTLASFAAAGYGLKQAHNTNSPSTLSPLGLAAGLIGVWALVQCIPLPAQLLALLSPEHARLRAELAPLVGTTPAGPISLAPAQTTLAAV